MQNPRDNFSRVTTRKFGALRYRRRRFFAASGLLLSIALFLALLTSITGGPERHAPDQASHTEGGDGTANILLVGHDSREGQNLSDVLMVAQIEEGSGEVRLLSIPRDFYVPIPNARQHYQKINAAYAIGGPQLTVKTVERFTGLSIDHYAAVDFKGFTKAIDAVDGVPIKVEKSYHERGYSGINLDPGKQTLSGKQALAYVRFRHNSRGDFGRIERQQKLLSTLMDRFISSRGVMNAPELVGIAEKYLKTDMSRAQMLALARKFQEAQKGGDVKSVTLKGDPASLEDKGYVLIPDSRKNSELLSLFRG